MSAFKGGLALGIGSMPHSEMSQAIDLIMQNIPNAPHWPQLQAIKYTEKFIPQAVEGMPCIAHVPEKGDVFVEAADGCAEGLVEFYEKYMQAEQTNDWSAFAISPDYGSGIYAFRDYLVENKIKPQLLKMQLVGPVSFGFTLNDQNGKAIMYNPDLYDASSKLLVAKARWQINLFKELADELLYFFDEPALSSFGSTAMITITKEDVIERFNEMADAIRAGGAKVGVHVCGRTDWSILLDSRIDLLNYDAYLFGNSLAIYADQLGAFLKRGGWIAFGIIPTSVDIDDEDADSLEKKLRAIFKEVADAGGPAIDALAQRTIITPSCGCGTLSIEQTQKAYQLLKELQERFEA
jgi:methionine synthase II (cobalamin-independent)